MTSNGPLSSSRSLNSPVRVIVAAATCSGCAGRGPCGTPSAGGDAGRAGAGRAGGGARARRGPGRAARRVPRTASPAGPGRSPSAARRARGPAGRAAAGFGLTLVASMTVRRPPPRRCPRCSAQLERGRGGGPSSRRRRPGRGRGPRRSPRSAGVRAGERRLADPVTPTRTTRLSSGTFSSDLNSSRRLFPSKTASWVGGPASGCSGPTGRKRTWYR